MEWIIALVIGLVVGGFGGWVGSDVAYFHRPIQTNTIIQDITQITKVSTESYSLQGQMTIVDTKTNVNYDINWFTNMVSVLSNLPKTNTKK